MTFRLRIIDRLGRDCRLAERRAILPDDEFWHLVLNGAGTAPDIDWDPDDDPGDYQPTTCRSCGELGACAHDAEGRPLIHADRFEEDE